MKHVVLIGFMGCGKSSVGKKLSKRLEWKFADTDKMIEEKMKMKITDIFEQYGESYFRGLETEVLKELGESQVPQVISVGGGLPVQEQNRPYLKGLGIIVYLTASKAVLIDRLKTDTTRPILQGGDLEQKITLLLQERDPIYKQAADFEIDTSRDSFGKIIEKIVEKIQQVL